MPVLGETSQRSGAPSPSYQAQWDPKFNNLRPEFGKWGSRLLIPVLCSAIGRCQKVK